MPRTLECEAVLSDLILQAARQAIPAEVEKLIQLPDAGQRNNKHLLALLCGLMDATKVVAAAVADNAWDDCFPLDQQEAAGLAKQARSIASDIESATQCPDARGFSLPSMSGKELV